VYGVLDAEDAGLDVVIVVAVLAVGNFAYLTASFILHPLVYKTCMYQ
jgi:hypothetical protein